MADRNTTWQEWESVGDNRPPVYDDTIQPRSGPYADEPVTVRVFRASGFGNCDRSLVAWGMGIDGDSSVPETMRRAWAEGHRNEPIILNLLRTRELKTKDRTGTETVEAWKLLDAYDIEAFGYGVVEQVGGGSGGGDGPEHADQTKVIIPFHGLSTPSELRASLDGVAQVYASVEGKGLPTGTRAVAEVKAFAESTYTKWLRHGLEAFPYYEVQVSVQAHATGLPVLFVVGIKDGDGVVQDIVTDYYPTPPISLGKLKARVAKLNRLIEQGSLDFACPEPKMYPCPHLFLHDEEADKARVEEARVRADEIPDVGVLQMVMKQYAEAKAAIDAAKPAVKEGDKIIKEWVKDHPEMAGKDLLIPVGDGEAFNFRVDVVPGKEREAVGEELERRLELAKTIVSSGRTTIKTEKVDMDEEFDV